MGLLAVLMLLNLFWTHILCGRGVCSNFVISGRILAGAYSFHPLFQQGSADKNYELSPVSGNLAAKSRLGLFVCNPVGAEVIAQAMPAAALLRALMRTDCGCTACQWL